MGWVEPFELWEEDLNKRANDEATFWRRWNGPTIIYVLTDRAKYDKLRGESERKFYLVAQTDYNVVFSNKLEHRLAPD